MKKNITFKIWMFGYPIVLAMLSTAIPHTNVSPIATAIATFINIVVWAGIGALLHEPREA